MFSPRLHLKNVRRILASVVVALGISGLAHGQFASSSLERSSSSTTLSTAASKTPTAQAITTPSKICDADVLPPANPTGPWRFRYCNSDSSETIVCTISARDYVTRALSSAALRARVISVALSQSSLMTPPEGFAVSCVR